jgi:hypothetical protein
MGRDPVDHDKGAAIETCLVFTKIPHIPILLDFSCSDVRVVDHCMWGSAPF